MKTPPLQRKHYSLYISSTLRKPIWNKTLLCKSANLIQPHQEQICSVQSMHTHEHKLPYDMLVAFCTDTVEMPQRWENKRASITDWTLEHFLAKDEQGDKWFWFVKGPGDTHIHLGIGHNASVCFHRSGHHQNECTQHCMLYYHKNHSWQVSQFNDREVNTSFKYLLKSQSFPNLNQALSA